MAHEEKVENTSDEDGGIGVPIFDNPIFALGNVDWFLSELVEIAELDFVFDVTLTVGGSHVSGKLIPAKSYFEAVSRMFKGLSAAEDDFLSSLAQRWQQHADTSERPDDEELGNVRRYIHLEDARFHTTDGRVMPEKGVFQRFKLTAVEGFSFGRLEVSNTRSSI